MKNRFVLCLFLSLIITFPIVAQFLVQGIVVDSETNEPVPFVSIGIPEIYKGTSTNINGEFIIRVDSLPVNLLISHISYKRQLINVVNDVPLRIRLVPTEIMMEELVISGKSQTEYAYSLLEKAFDRINAFSNKSNYGKAFYRQISQNDSDYSELYEIFFDTRYSCAGILDWAVQEGRYAMDTGPGASDYVYNKNFTQVNRVFTMIQPETDKFIMPVNYSVRSLYDVRIGGSRNIDGHKTMIVQFSPKEGITIPALEGEVLIDNQTYDIYMISGKIKHDNFDVIGLTNPVGSWKNYEIQFTSAYKRDSNNLLLDYIKLDQQFDYYVDGKFRHKVATHSFLSIYEYYTPDRSKNLGGRLVRFTRSDRDILDKVGYNRDFWDENPIVKRTPLEQNVITSFEASNAFGSIYLNDKEQVQLENSDIDKDLFIQQATVAVKNTHLASRGEKVYLHLDKPFYASGETIWFSAYLVNASTNIPFNFLTTLYVDLIDPEGKIKMSKLIKINGDLHEGSFDIPDDFTTGIYRIRAYTNWMKNQGNEYFFDKPVSIFNASEVLSGNYVTADKYADFDVQFFPEGGYSIDEIPGLVAFKAMDERGVGIDITGKIVDNKGKLVTNITTKHDGMGSFFIMPDSAKKYKAIVNYLTDQKEFDLPESLHKGITATINTLKNNVIQVIIKGSSDYNNRDVYIIGQTRGIVYHKEKVKVIKGGAITTIPKAKLSPGIFHITLFDDNKIPRFERLVFVKPENEMLVNIKASGEKPGYREPENITLKIKDQFGKPVSGANVSVSVTDASKISISENAENIETYLLIQSDLPGIIVNPGYYFQNDDRETLLNLDLLMLTHGWRRFKWEKLLNNSPEEIRYSQESGINISGTIYKENTKVPLKNAYVNFISLNRNHPGYITASSDQSGRFILYGLDIPDTLKVLTQALDLNGKPVDADITIDKIESYPASDIQIQKFPATVHGDILKYLGNEQKYAQLIGEGNEPRIMMKEVVIRATRFDQSIYGTPDDIYVPGNEALAFTDIFQMMQGRLTGVNITGSGMTTKITIRGISSIAAGTSPLFLIDGVPISMTNFTMPVAGSSGTGNTTPIIVGGRPVNVGGQSTQQSATPQQGSGYDEVNSMLLTINPHDVDRIEVLKNAGSTAIFGVRGANGVIAIYTKKGGVSEENIISKGYSSAELRGYSLVREFYFPKYDNISRKGNQPDIRSLLYWNPQLKTDRKGEIEFGYSNSDTAKKHQIVIEGITDFGDMIFIRKDIGQETQ